LAPHRVRHDGFTPEKQRRFLKALTRTGCISDACRAVRISRETVRRHRNKWAEFDGKVTDALGLAAAELETIAWKRATVGAEEKVIRDGKVVAIKVKPSDAMLKLLLQGANPKKYGRIGRGGMTRRQIEKQLRKEITRELEAKYKPEIASVDEVCAALARRLKESPPQVPEADD
jgi:hypothetical protein